MSLLIILFVLSIVVAIIGLVLVKKEHDMSYCTGSLVATFIAGTIMALIVYEITAHNTFKTKELPQIDTVVTYTSVNQQFDTTYIYTFKDE